MSVAVEKTGAPAAAVRQAAAQIRLDGVGVRFDYDRLRRVLSPALKRIRVVRATTYGLREIDLRIEPGEAVALVGPTGSGKTTLLRVIAGVMPADEGEADVQGRVGSLLAVGGGVGLWLTGRENTHLLGVLYGLSLSEIRENLERVSELSRLGDAFDRPVHTYSEGMRARLGFAVIQLVSPQILLLDEVFEALDHEFRAKVEDYAAGLRERGGIVVAAGHDHDALARMAPRTVWLSEGSVAGDGPTAETIARYRRAVSDAAASDGGVS